MNQSVILPPNAEPVDQDLAEQAVPGHGIPSQDPDPAAQVLLDPQEAERERKSVLMGGGMVAGMATGAAIGGAVAGPLGVLVGVPLGVAVVALGGAAAGAAASPDGPSSADAVPTDSVRLHVDDSGGSGRSVVLIHGWPLSAQAWEPQVAALRDAGYRVVAYDRRGFGRSDKPESGFSYDILADDLQRVLDQCELQDVTLVGFSMGGGEVARYIGRHGESRLHSVVFAAAVPPCLMKTADNPEGPLTPEKAQQTRKALEEDRRSFFEMFTKDFFSANGVLQVTEAQRSAAVALCNQSAQQAALACMDSFGTTDFREDLKKVTVPTLVIHGEADAIVPLEGSGLRTHRGRGPQPTGDGEGCAAWPECVARAGLQRCAAVVPADVNRSDHCKSIRLRWPRVHGAARLVRASPQTSRDRRFVTHLGNLNVVPAHGLTALDRPPTS